MLCYAQSAHGLEWRRPHELTEDPRLFVDGGGRFDINQV
jgi:Calpain family cysteine protease